MRKSECSLKWTVLSPSNHAQGSGRGFGPLIFKILYQTNGG